jgi:hypothetical protein
MTLYNARGDYLVGAVLPLATRQKRDILNERRMERPPVAMQAARNMVLREHPSATLRSLTSVYDCMGMVFAARRTTVGIDQLEMILEDDEYQRLPNPDGVRPGDIVVYRDSQGLASHVGLVSSTGPILQDGRREIIILSQWGADGEYFHRVDDASSAFGTHREYWSDRK